MSLRLAAYADSDGRLTLPAKNLAVILNTTTSCIYLYTRQLGFLSKNSVKGRWTSWHQATLDDLFTSSNTAPPMTYATAAQVLGVSPATVRQRLRKARRRYFT